MPRTAACGNNMKILLGMSGGLDSTFAAHKLITQGHEVEGAVLEMHGYTDVSSARESAEALGIKLHVIDCRERFSNIVIENFLDEYTLGRTPNPCIVCNSEVKFAALLEYALKCGFDAIATGHYAKICKKETENGPRYSLLRAIDTSKDQTYMLWRLSQDILSHLLLPLADDLKSDVRASAREIGLASADREESQEICFIPDGDYASYIEDKRGVSKKGAFINNEGKILGEHNGIIRYTVCQRKGLGIAMGERVFVTKIDPVANTVTLSPDDSYADFIEISGMVFSGIEEPPSGAELDLSVKVRYPAPPIKSKFTYLGNGLGRAELASPVRAVAAGQSAVFYDGNELVAGGFVDKSSLK